MIYHSGIKVRLWWKPPLKFNSVLQKFNSLWSLLILAITNLKMVGLWIKKKKYHIQIFAFKNKRKGKYCHRTQQKQQRRCNIVATSLYNVALTSPYSRDGNVGQRWKTTFYSVAFQDVIMKCCNDVVFATSSSQLHGEVIHLHPHPLWCFPRMFPLLLFHFLCVIFDHYCEPQFYFKKTDWVLGSVSTHFWDVSYIS